MKTVPRWLERCSRIEVFDESRQRYADEPRWAWIFGLFSASVAYAAFAGGVYSLLNGRSATNWALVHVAAYALASGATWHLGMRARAANQIIISGLCLAVIWLWQTY